MRPGLRDTYERLILDRPVLVLSAVALITLASAWFAQYFALDASADSLVLERDADLRYYRFIKARYGSDDYLIVTYTPESELFADETLRDLGSLRDELASLAFVEKVTTVLDVPLVASPRVKLREIATGVRYLENLETDRGLARAELLESPLYRDLIISADGRTTALRVDMRADEKYLSLREARDELREKQAAQELSPDETSDLAALTSELDELRLELIAQEERDIAAVRTVLDAHRSAASLHLGGVPMIIADSIEFIRRDLLVFGAAVLVFLVVILASVFKKRRWIVLPLLTCAATCVFMVGLLGFLGWRVTIVSSNFLSLVFILCLALTLHFIVRYRELHEKAPEAGQRVLVSKTVARIVTPCLYTALTTIVAFGSLLFSGIRPVIDFGWTMSIGVAVAFVYSFTLFPAGLMLLPPGSPRSRNDLTKRITLFFAGLIRRHGPATLIVFSLLAVIGVSGATRLSVENRFIDYYRDSTEIYQGMELIDRKLGGTTPLDVIIDAPAGGGELPAPAADAFDDFDDFLAAEGDAGAGLTSRSFWYNSRNLGEVLAIHDYLDGLAETGKVVSLATAVRILEQLDPGIVRDNFELSVLYERLTPDLRQALFTPYLSADGDQLRISVRVFESDPSLHRAKLLQRIRADLTEELSLRDDQIHLTGMLVLYNNMLESLFQSQILTLGVVFLAIMLMFLALFRSLRVAATAVVPNLLAACLVLGLMGWFGIPLDLMTITIAAITVGIGVDDTIHYVHRFRLEFARDGNYWESIARCHQSIGRAIYYTSITVMLGFSILALSQFVPTVYFGLLTSLAMLVALLANITLLPLLIVTFRVAGRGRRCGAAGSA